MASFLFVVWPYLAVVIFEAFWSLIGGKKIDRKDKAIFRREIAKITRGITKPR